MELPTAIQLIQKGVKYSENPQRWADLGCGSGLFTRALSTLLPEGSEIFCVDLNDRALQKIEEPAGIRIHKVLGDFRSFLSVTKQLDGILMANALHFERDKPPIFSDIFKALLKNGSLIVVEYDTLQSNLWVPFPLNFTLLKQLVHDAGFPSLERAHKVPSVYNASNIYAAVARR